MVESLGIAGLVSLIESQAIPLLGAWLVSELLGISKKTKFNGIFQLLFGLLKTVGKELGEQQQKSEPEPQPQTPVVDAAVLSQMVADAVAKAQPKPATKKPAARRATK